MRKIFTSLAMMSLALTTALAQNITLKFTGVTTSGDYVQMDSVQVQNLTRSWTETLVYPDTVLEFPVVSIAEAQGAETRISAYPNPATGFTNVTVSVAQSGEATLQMYNLAGQRVAERVMALEAGQNHFEVRMQTAQVYLLAVATAQGCCTIKLLNSCTGAENGISFRGNSNAVEKRQSSNPFQSGDELKIVGFAINSGIVIASAEVQQQQTTSENITLLFALPAVSNSVSVSPSTRVVFSSGNLQWSATNGGSTATTHAVAGGGTAAGTWRFAPNQWDTIGSAHSNMSSSYNGWIDLFGWGTSGYNNKYPYMTSTTHSDYGNGNTDIFGTNYDWGVFNAIYAPKTRTTYAPGSWRTLTRTEWTYLLDTRSTTSGIRYAKATVNGVQGLIIVPDNWSASTYALDSTNTRNTTFTTNVISAAQWVTLENAGATFLPCNGNRSGTLVSAVSVREGGYYWSATYFSSDVVYALNFGIYGVGVAYAGRSLGRSVRLVKDM
jgi:hypothetical protein